MRHQRGLLAICGIFLIVSACSPASPPKVTPSSASPAASVAPSTAVSPSATAISPESISAVDTILANLTSQDLLSGSVLISQHGHVLLSKGYGFADRAKKTPNDPNSRFAIGSITKQFTAAAILLLEVQGKLKVGDLICAYIAQCPTAWGVITIKELLTHMSGIPDYLNTLHSFSGYAGPPLTPLQIIGGFRDVPLEFAPGTSFAYSSSGYVLLGYIIEQVSGLSYEAFLQKNIFTPLNLSDTGYNHNSNGVVTGYDTRSVAPMQPMEPSIPYAAGGLYSTVEDMNRWEQALTTDALLPAASRAEMFSDQTSGQTAGYTTDYGYGFWVGTDDSGRTWIGHGGALPGFQSIENRYPIDDVTIIVLSNQYTLDPSSIEEYISAKIFKAE
jgi:CubicO group peptidase (beta-lactamase class C family)